MFGVLLGFFSGGGGDSVWLGVLACVFVLLVGVFFGIFVKAQPKKVD